MESGTQFGEHRAIVRKLQHSRVHIVVGLKSENEIRILQPVGDRGFGEGAERLPEMLSPPRVLRKCNKGCTHRTPQGRRASIEAGEEPDGGSVVAGGVH